MKKSTLGLMILACVVGVVISRFAMTPAPLIHDTFLEAGEKVALVELEASDPAVNEIAQVVPMDAVSAVGDAGSASQLVLSEEPEPISPFAQTPVDAPLPISDSNYSAQVDPAPVAESVSVEESLRTEFVELARQKAEHMVVDELRAEIESAKSKLQELKAKRRLESAVGGLNALIENFPQTNAATEARKLLSLPQLNSKERFEGEGEKSETETPSRFGAASKEASGPREFQAQPKLEFDDE